MNAPTLTPRMTSDAALRRYATDPRVADWRFLLPTLPRGTVLCVGGALSPTPLALAQTAGAVTVLDSAADLAILAEKTRGLTNIAGLAAGPGGSLALPPQRFDLVAAQRAAPGAHRARWQARDLAALAARVAPGGTLYLEVAPARPYGPTPGRVRERLAALGLWRSRAYWPKPSFDQCELLLPLGDHQLQDYYLNEMFFALSPARRVLRLALHGAVRLGLFDRLVPGYLILARRPGGEQST